MDRAGASLLGNGEKQPKPPHFSASCSRYSAEVTSTAQLLLLVLPHQLRQQLGTILMETQHRFHCPIFDKLSWTTQVVCYCMAVMPKLFVIWSLPVLSTPQDKHCGLTPSLTVRHQHTHGHAQSSAVWLYLKYTAVLLYLSSQLEEQETHLSFALKGSLLPYYTIFLKWPRVTEWILWHRVPMWARGHLKAHTHFGLQPFSISSST